MQGLSIIFRDDGPGPCVICSEPTGIGPLGHIDGQGSVCDACLMEQHQHLGTVLVMANLVREFGGRKPADMDEDLHLMALLMSVARLYAKSAAKSWPARPPGFLEDFGEFLSQVSTTEPVDDV